MAEFSVFLFSVCFLLGILNLANLNIHIQSTPHNWDTFVSGLLSQLNSYKVRKNSNIVLVTIFDKLQKFTKIFFTRTFEVDYSGIYFVENLCACDLPTYYLNLHQWLLTFYVQFPTFDYPATLFPA